MEADTFKSRTKATNAVGGFVSKFKSRGSSMAGIDIALERWSKNCNNSLLSSRTKLDLVEDIARECDVWFAKKAKLKKSSDLGAARAQVVAEVRRSCPKAFQYLKNKARTEAVSPQFGAVKRGNVKGLEKGYSHERTDYLAGNKQSNPYSASAVSEVRTNDIEKMSYSQFSQAATDVDSLGTPADRVEFMNRRQRLDHLIMIQNGLLYQNGELMSSDIVRQMIYADTFAVDKYGNFYSKKIKYGSALRFNHSSYCAGKEVLCAGTLACHQGRLLYISNLSGHYKPNAASVRQVLQILAEENVPLDKTLVECKDTDQSVDAITFLKAPKTKSNWPHHAMDRGTNKPAVDAGGNMLIVDNPK